MPFSHAEHLYEQKHDVLKQKHALLEAERCTKQCVCFVFKPSERISYDRQAVKTCLLASISANYFVKDSE